MAIDAYEQKYQEEMFGSENFPRFMAESQRRAGSFYAVGIAIGLANGIRVDYGDFFATPIAGKIHVLSEKFRAGFKVDEVADIRRYYIDVFDNKWEPILRQAVADADPRLTV